MPNPLPSFLTLASNPNAGADANAFLDYDSAAETNPPRNRNRRRPQAAGNNVPDMIIVPHWDEEGGEIWDRIVLGAYQFGGTVRIDGDGPKMQLDKRKHPGSDGATLVSKGYDLADFKIILRVWTKEQLDDFSSLMPEIHPARNTSGRNAITVYHPALALASISRCVVTGVGLLKPTGTPGLFECELACTEFRPPSNANVTQRVNPNTASIGVAPTDPRFLTNQDNPNTVAPPSATNAEP